jgi:hypothetical protein
MTHAGVVIAPVSRIMPGEAGECASCPIHLDMMVVAHHEIGGHGAVDFGWDVDVGRLVMVLFSGRR